MQKSNTSARGNAFRDSIKTLLECSPRFSNVKREIQIAHQDVDIYYEENTSSGVIRVACECKEYAKPLTRSDLESIYAKYQPLLGGTHRAVEAVRIFAPLPFGANAQSYLAQIGFSFSTRDDLELNIIDFTSYLKSITSQYREQLGNVYVRHTLDKGADAEATIFEWLKGASGQPIAILAGYGSGKTSFALHIAAILANERLYGASVRIPILIPLSEISSEQSIEGLLGKLFAAQYRVPNYYYGLFQELNVRGRLFVILDGFDEMKHAMSVPDFQLNFAQLHSLVNINSRLLMLGRPSAFLSESEEHHVLRGVQLIDGEEIELPGAPEYKLLRLSQFSVPTAFEFIERYLSDRGPRQKAVRGQQYHHDDSLIQLKRVFSNPELATLAQRPVHARMIADLIIDGTIKWQSFSRYQLYSIFIQRIIQREMEKHVRRPLKLEARVEFHRRLAWWLWQQRRVSFTVHDIPDDVLGHWPKGTGIDREGYIRELLTGSLLDKKVGDKYFFPHRSFVEFLVAQRILSTDLSTGILEDLAQATGQDVILEFLKDPGAAGIVASWGKQLDSLQVPLRSTLLELIAAQMNVCEALPDADVPSDITPRQFYLTFARIFPPQSSPAAQFDFLEQAFHQLNSNEARLLCLILMVQKAESLPHDPRQAQDERIAATLAACCIGQLSEVLKDENATRYPRFANPFVLAFAKACASAQLDDEWMLSINVTVLLETLRAELDNIDVRWAIPDLRAASARTAIVALNSLSQWNPQLAQTAGGAILREFMRRYPIPSVLVPARRALWRPAYGV